MPDGYTEIEFPERGIDLTRGFGKQVPKTTPVGTNVQTFEASTDRSRGGTRPMLSKYVLPQLPNGSSLIQHLNYVVDPSADAILFDQDYSGPFIDDPSTNPTGSDPSDDNDFRVRNRGRFLRPGGSGIQINRNRRKRSTQTIAFVQANQSSYADDDFPVTPIVGSDTFDSPITAGNLIVLGVATYRYRGGSGPLPPNVSTFGVTDTQGNAYTQIGSYVRVTMNTTGIVPGGETAIVLSLWYAIASATGSPTLNFTTTTPGNNLVFDSVGTGVYMYEFTNNDPSSPLDDTSSNTGDSTSVTAGTPIVSNPGTLVLGIFGIDALSVPFLFTPGSGFTKDPIAFSWPSGGGTAFEYITGRSGDTAVVGTVGAGAYDNRYGGIAASFIPAP